MGLPKFTPQDIPLVQDAEQLTYKLDINDNEYKFMSVSVGNPHAVLTVDSVIDYPVATIGKIIEAHAMFPERVNVGFMQILDKENVNLRVYERGAGETLACGSGACAAVACGINAGVLSKKVKIMLFGGDLLIEWQGKGQHIYLTGPAINVYKGEIKI
jgi:diaminopimelate epimerase